VLTRQNAFSFAASARDRDDALSKTQRNARKQILENILSLMTFCFTFRPTTTTTTASVSSSSSSLKRRHLQKVTMRFSSSTITTFTTTTTTPEEERRRRRRRTRRGRGRVHAAQRQREEKDDLKAKLKSFAREMNITDPNDLVDMKPGGGSLFASPKDPNGAKNQIREDEQRALNVATSEGFTKAMLGVTVGLLALYLIIGPPPVEAPLYK
jgi:hypothetical protein